ncbi:MAG TPA: hypothetical protein VE959_17115 [Bryobacteraceae bacterium]|nr:hypothetical protein [Bryobacteraceae bacterium]
MSLLGLLLYVRLAWIIDQRLAEGPFSASADILAAPGMLAVGETIAPTDLLQSLRRSGYTTSQVNPAGWFEESPRAIEIFPGAIPLETSGR